MRDALHPRRLRLCLLGALAVVLAAAATALATSGPLPGPSAAAGGGASAKGAPLAAAKRSRYLPLGRLGVAASGATLVDRTLSVRVRSRRKVRLSLAVVEGAKVRASVPSLSVRRGARTLTRTLDRKPVGTRLRLRVTARRGAKRARKTIPLAVLLAPGGGGPTPSLLPENRAPTAISLSNAQVAENEPAGTAVGTFSGSDPDPGDTLIFTLVTGAGSDDNGSFQITANTLRTNAPLDFEAKSAYSIRVRAADGKGGVLERQFTVTVTDLPDAGISLSASSVAENQPAATTIGTLSANPGSGHSFALVAGEGGTHNAQFQIVGDKLQTSQPLDYEAGATRSIRVRSTDSSGGVLERQLTIAVTNVNEAPTADDESLSGSARAVGNTTLVADDPSDGAPDPAGPQKTVSADILAGDSDPEGAALTVTAQTKVTSDGGSVTIEADGDFTYHPAAGRSCTDHSDFFDYTISDGTLSDVGRVTIEIQDCVWYIDAAAGAGGDGRSHAPFNSTASINGAGGTGDVDASGQNLFLYPGSYSGGLALEASQQLFSKRHGLVVSDGAGGNLALEPAASAGSPSTLAGGLTLASNNVVQGVDLGAVAGTALSGTSVGNAVMNTQTPGAINNPSGRAVNITGGALNMAFSAISSANSPTNAITLAGTSGSFAGAGGSLRDATGADVSLSGGSLNFTYDGQVSDDVGQLVSVANQTGGTKDFNGQLTDGGDGDGSGIALTSNTGATIRFDGGLTLSTGANPAFAATGGGTVAVTDPAGATDNTLATTTATALNLTNTAISAANLTFRSISSAGGTATGIIADNTGSAGGLVVTGDGTAGSGGTIANKTGADGANASGIGIYLNNTKAVSLTRMALHDFSNFAIHGTSVDGFTLANSVVNGVNGSNSSIDEASIAFTGLTGSANVSSSSISGGVENNLTVLNTGGTLNRLTLSGTTIGPNSQATGNDGVSLETKAGTFNVTVRDSVFTSASGDLFQLSALGTAASDLIFTGNALSNNHPSIVSGGGGVTISSAESADLRYDIDTNSFRDSKGTALLVSKAFGGPPGDATASGTIENNTIGVSGVPNSGSAQGSGIDVIQLARGSHTTLIRNNKIYGYNNFGVLLTAGGAAESVTGLAHDGAFNATVQGNVIAQPGTLGTLSMNGVHLNSGTNAGDGYQVCLQLGDAADVAKKNTVAGSGALGGTDYRLRQRMETTVRMPGYTGVPTDAGGTLTAALTSYLAPRTNGAFTLSAIAGPAGGFFNTPSSAPCATP